jgi:cholesterol transport system auxiliary component
VTVSISCPAVIVTFCLLPGCALMPPVTVDANKYVLNAIPPEIPTEHTRSASVLVLTPQTSAAYATTKMAYSSQEYKIAYFAKNQWAATPSQMIHPLIVQTLQQSHYFREVVSPPYFGVHTFELRTEILELEQDFTRQPAMLKLAMRVTLTRSSTNEIVASKELAESQPMDERDPYAGVVAANQVVPKLLRSVAQFVVENAD